MVDGCWLLVVGCWLLFDSHTFLCYFSKKFNFFYFTPKVFQLILQLENKKIRKKLCNNDSQNTQKKRKIVVATKKMCGFCSFLQFFCVGCDFVNLCCKVFSE